jgi:hypothetical protein
VRFFVLLRLMQISYLQLAHLRVQVLLVLAQLVLLTPPVTW